MDCLFCKIIEGSIPSVKVYEDDAAVAALNSRDCVVSQDFVACSDKLVVELIYLGNNAALP